MKKILLVALLLAPISAMALPPLPPAPPTEKNKPLPKYEDTPYSLFKTDLATPSFHNYKEVPVPVNVYIDTKSIDAADNIIKVFFNVRNLKADDPVYAEWTSVKDKKVRLYHMRIRRMLDNPNDDFWVLESETALVANSITRAESVASNTSMDGMKRIKWANLSLSDGGHLVLVVQYLDNTMANCLLVGSSGEKYNGRWDIRVYPEGDGTYGKVSLDEKSCSIVVSNEETRNAWGSAMIAAMLHGSFKDVIPTVNDKFVPALPVK